MIAVKKSLILSLSLLLLSSAAYAGEKNLHKAACLEMLKASQVPQMMKRAFDSQLENQFKALPELEKLRPQLTEFYRKAFSFKELEPELCALYMKHYSLQELKQITAFYRTPAGRKKAEVDGILSAELGALFLKHSQKKMPELQKLLERLDAKGK